MRLNHPEVNIPIPTEQDTGSLPNPFCLNGVGSADHDSKAVHPCHNNGDVSTNGKKDKFTVEQEMLFKRQSVA